MRNETKHSPYALFHETIKSLWSEILIANATNEIQILWLHELNTIALKCCLNLYPQLAELTTNLLTSHWDFSIDIWIAKSIACIEHCVISFVSLTQNNLRQKKNFNMDYVAMWNESEISWKLKWIWFEAD